MVKISSEDNSRDNLWLLAQFVGALALSYVIAFIVNPCLLELGVYRRVGSEGIENALFAFMPLLFALLYISCNYLRERPLGLSWKGAAMVLACCCAGLLYGFIGSVAAVAVLELASLRKRRHT